MIAMSLIFIPFTAHAALESVTISSQDRLSAPRWMYGVGEFPKSGLDATALALAKVKEAQAQGNDSQCAERARAAKPKAKSLQAWLAVTELECATRVEPSMKSAGASTRWAAWSTWTG